MLTLNVRIDGPYAGELSLLLDAVKAKIERLEYHGEFTNENGKVEYFVDGHEAAEICQSCNHIVDDCECDQ